MFIKNWKIISLAVLGAVFFIVYLYLYLPSAPKYPKYLILNQPDESVNYFFIRDLAINHRFVEPEPSASWTGSQVHPRSTTVVYGSLAPIGFPGMIVIFGTLLGLLVKIFGVGHFNLLAVMLTPFLAAVTSLFFYGFLRRVWDERGAWLSSALLFFLPPWWYYASRPFQHNTLLVFLVVAGLYCYTMTKAASRHPEIACLPVGKVSGSQKMPKQVRHDDGKVFLSGLCFGLAIYVRPSEIVWLAALGIYGLVMARKTWSWREYFFCGVGLALTAILFFTTQTVFYGAALASGYVRPAIDGAGGIITDGPQGIGLIKAVFLPFGLHFGAIARNFYAYFFKLFGVWSFVGILGIFIVSRVCHSEASAGWRSRRISFQFCQFNRSFGRLGSLRMTYVIVFLLISAFLLIFYGSWRFFDNLLREPSIGTSYVRYFLPIYVFALPFLSFFLLWLWQKKHIFKIVTVILFMALAINSLAAVFAPLEGLSAVKAMVSKYGEWQEKIYSLTEDDSVIVTRYADKYLFPNRKIIPGWEMTEQKDAIIFLAQKGTPIYLYDLKLTEKEEGEWQKFLADKNLKLSPPLANWENLELRKIK